MRVFGRFKKLDLYTLYSSLILLVFLVGSLNTILRIGRLMPLLIASLKIKATSMIQFSNAGKTMVCWRRVVSYTNYFSFPLVAFLLDFYSQNPVTIHVEKWQSLFTIISNGKPLSRFTILYIILLYFIIFYIILSFYKIYLLFYVILQNLSYI